MAWSFLEGVPEDDRRRLLAATQRRRFARREVLFHEADPGDTVHLLDRGRVAVRITTPVGDVATLRVRGPGEVIGELALLADGPRRAATVVALERVETLALHRDQFVELRRRHPSVDAFLVNVLAEEVRRLSGLLVEALHVPVDIRVVRRLVALVDDYRDPDNEGEPTEVPLTQEDLASLAGTSRATVNRVVGEAERAGLVQRRRGRIVVTDPAGLARLGR
ncbi:MAG TPA: Crp/Fnr family transcriptional regulator [Acidimicrobiales bacterium]|nr:Crp/Fnr family transcriptional regulator [Acidimicrobiales bacterium]